MRITTAVSAKRSAMLSIALLSCIQIIFGFLLLTGEGHESAAQAQTAKTQQTAQICNQTNAKLANVSPAYAGEYK